MLLLLLMHQQHLRQLSLDFSLSVNQLLLSWDEIIQSSQYFILPIYKPCLPSQQLMYLHDIQDMVHVEFPEEDTHIHKFPSAALAVTS